MNWITSRLQPVVVSILLLAQAAAAAPVSAQDGPSVAIVDAGATASWGYDPKSLQVTVGDTVTWTNTGTQPHTVTAADVSFDSGDLQPGDTFDQTLMSPGTIRYTCTPHPWMVATITVVQAADPGSGATDPAATAGDTSQGTDPGNP